MQLGSSRPGFERLEAEFFGHAFDPHRHDTYALGLTTRGLQSFGYRGWEHHSARGHAIVLHPDETHDGHAGDRDGFRYRMLYIEPRLIHDALGANRHPLPFVADAVTRDARLLGALAPALENLDTPLEDLEIDQMVGDIAEALCAVDGSAPALRLSGKHLRAVATARDLIEANLVDGVSSADLEAETGLDRYELARQFRNCLGTSPYRYLTMRRLDLVRKFLSKGESLSAAAHASGFADQSHMTRHFRKAYGMSPGRWADFAVRSELAHAT